MPDEWKPAQRDIETAISLLKSKLPQAQAVADGKLGFICTDFEVSWRKPAHNRGIGHLELREADPEAVGCVPFCGNSW